MNLAVPLTAAGEAWILHNAGASEFYCGLQTSAWENMFGNHDSVSRRQGRANIATKAELEKIAAEVKNLSAPFFLTLNGYYTEEQLPYILEMEEFFEEIGGTGVMVCDLGLLVELKKRNSKLVRGLSLIAAAGSVSAVCFYQELGVTRIVFPRFLSVAQMKALKDSFSGIQWEAIVWLDKCRFIDGFCRFIHSVGYISDNTCEEKSEKDDCIKIIYSHDTDYMLPACFELFGHPSKTPACAACSLADMSNAGVNVFKMGGRGRSLETRLAGVQFLTSAIGGDNRNKKNLYRDFFGEDCTSENCYYKSPNMKT
ncbi:MAG: U32 family peptidase [Oscillospiraceae bacterium]|nr:U32 family peptidase [Oscillospiraceae bacterium]